MAPRYDGAQVLFRDFTDLNANVLGTPVEPATPLSMRIRVLMYGLSLMYSGYSDRTFLDHARVFYVGTSDGIDSSRPAVEFNDTLTGRRFRAYSFPRNGQELGIGARMILRANTLSAAASGTGGESEATRKRAAQMLRDQVDLLEMSRALTRELEWSRFGGPKGG
jgi:hypothetical protein